LGERWEVPARHEEERMTQYPLSVHSVEDEARDPMTDEEMRQFMERVGVLEEEMKSAGAWLFGGALHEPDTATVVRMADGEVLTTARSDTYPRPERLLDIDAAPKLDEAEVGRIFREESGRSVAALIRVFGDVDVAEDAVQEAFAVALRKWPGEGLPPNPGGWITTTAADQGGTYRDLPNRMHQGERPPRYRAKYVDARV
jgi:hypothetical protein